MEVVVAIVGAGPSGLATSACLNRLSVENIVLEREDCYASLWKKRTYDRMALHIAKQFCQLPHMPYPSNTPKYIPKEGFINYLDEYVSHFHIRPHYRRSVESAHYDEEIGKWHINVKNLASNEYEIYLAKYLVVATGENSEGHIPNVNGLYSFDGEIMHSNKYENGERFFGKKVLVVGCGNSGMEIAYDLSNYGAKTSIVARSPVHLVTKELVYFGMILLKFLPVWIVDKLMIFLSILTFGNLSKYGLRRPKIGPFLQKITVGRSPTIDVGAVDKIKKGEIEVHPQIRHIKERQVTFANEKTDKFDAIIFATGYKSTVRNWLKGGYDLINEKGMPFKKFPNHWKGDKGLYCAGLASRALEGAANDAQNIANDISYAFNMYDKVK